MHWRRGPRQEPLGDGVGQLIYTIASSCCASLSAGATIVFIGTPRWIPPLRLDASRAEDSGSAGSAKGAAVSTDVEGNVKVWVVGDSCQFR